MSKQSIAISRLRNGDVKGALKMASSFRLGVSDEESTVLKRGYECMINPRFYAQLGYDPKSETEKAKAVMNALFGFD